MRSIAQRQMYESIRDLYRLAPAALGLSTREVEESPAFDSIRLMHSPHNQEYRSRAGFVLECDKAIRAKTAPGIFLQDGSILVPTDVLVRSLGAGIATRAMDTTPGSKGGYLVGVTNMAFIDILR